MLMELANGPETALLWGHISDMVVPADGGARLHLSALQNFEDDRIAGVLEFFRMIARTIIIMTAFLAVAFWAYGCYLLVSSGGDEQRLDKGRETFRRVLIGAAIGVSSYLLVSIAVNIYVGATGLDEIVAFWDDSVFAGGVEYGELLGHVNEIAFDGEVLLISDGDVPVVCMSSLDPAATAEGWSYSNRLPGLPAGSQDISGCIRVSP